MSLESMRLLNRDEFQLWLFRDEDVRTALDDLIGTTLDSDADSLDVIEEFILARFPDSASMLNLEGQAIADAVARHIGLVYVLNIDGARWDLELNEDSAYYLLPVIVFTDGEVDCPLTMATAACTRRTGDFLGDLFENIAEDHDG